MKKQILSFALFTAMIGSIAAGCSSQKNAGAGDTTKMKDTSKMTPMSADTMKKDTMMKKDTTHH